EVDVDALPRAELAHAGRPGVEVLLAIVVPPEAQVAERGCGDRRGREPVGVGDAEGGAVTTEQAIGLVVEPGVAPELEGGLETRRKRAEKLAEPIGVEAEIRGQLEEERAALR